MANMEPRIISSVIIKTEVPENEEKNISLVDFPFICRICFGRGDLRLFEEEKFLWELFMFLTKFDVHSAVDLPRKVCDECINKLEEISLFIDISKYTDLKPGKNVRVEDQTLSKPEDALEYDNKSSRYCLACLSSSNLSPFEEKNTLLQLFQEITEIDVTANTNVRNVKSICFKCIDELQKVSDFLNLSLITNEALQRLVKTNESKTHKTYSLPSGLESCTLSRFESKSSDNYQEQIEVGTETDQQKSSKDKEIQPMEEKSFKCDYCGRGFGRKDNLKRHSLTHTGEKPFKCDFCDKSFTRKSILRTHILTHTEEKPFKCGHCDTYFSTKFNLEKHLFLHIEKNHQIFSIDKEFQPIEKKSFKCDYCGIGFGLKSHLKSHLLTHTGEKPFKCDYCGIRFGRKDNLKRHFLTHTGEKPFKCGHCDTYFSTKFNLEKHLFLHIEKNHQISFTDKEFQPIEKKSFKCDYCGIGFGLKSHLKSHLLTHTGEKPFKCDYCGIRFGRKDNLKRHFLTHTGEKPFKCGHCDTYFSNKFNLEKHLFLHTEKNQQISSIDKEFLPIEEKSFKCDHCGLESCTLSRFESKSSDNYQEQIEVGTETDQQKSSKDKEIQPIEEKSFEKTFAHSH